MWDSLCCFWGVRAEDILHEGSIEPGCSTEALYLGQTFGPSTSPGACRYLLPDDRRSDPPLLREVPGVGLHQLSIDGRPCWSTVAQGAARVMVVVGVVVT